MVHSDSQKKVYKKNFITNVILRIDFPKILKLSEKKPPSELQNIIIDKFPILEEKRQSKIDTKIMKDSTVDVKSTIIVSWSFLNREKSINIFINPEYLTIEFYKYKNFTECFKNIKYIINNFIKLYPIKIINRVGLRYINKINLATGEPLDWNNLIHPSLFSVSREFINNKDSLLKSMHLLEFNEKEYRFRFQFGLFNSEYPNPITRKEFILDYDCMTTEEIEVSETLDKVKEFNLIITTWFEKSILDGLRKEMEDVKNGA